MESASVSFQILHTTEVTALVRDMNLEEGQVHDEIGQPECSALYLPLDLEYYQSLYLLFMHGENETGPTLLSPSQAQISHKCRLQLPLSK